MVLSGEKIEIYQMAGTKGNMRFLRRDADVSIKQKIQSGWNPVYLYDTEDVRMGGTVRVPPGLSFERNKNKTTAMRIRR